MRAGRFIQVIAAVTMLAVAFALTPRAEGPAVVWRMHSEIASVLADKARATPAAELTSAPVTSGPHHQINVVRRTKPQGAIAHAIGSEIHSVMDGSGTLVTGGTIVRPAGAERGGGRIDNGVRRRIAKGDVVLVPPGTPHWYEGIDGTITYLEMRFDVGAAKNAPAIFMSEMDLRKVLTERGAVPDAPLMFSSPVTRGDKYQANIVRRTKAQGGGAHELGTEVHQILDGAGTLVVGGTIVRPTSSNGPATIDGGESRRVEPGDVIFIPANTPHWYKDVAAGGISYLEVRFELSTP
jgi:mannose-6-phosphate isomerase-like protein (cupin superfamily)